MTARYSPRERIEMILAGEKPDRFAASFWRHFFHLENNARGTAEAMIRFQKELGWDFVKLNPRADYHIEGWGFRQEWSRHEFRKHTKLDFPIKRIEDWDNIAALPLQTPALAEHLEVISLVRRALGRDIPILMTVFTPLAVAGRMVADRQTMVEHLRTDPDRIHRALRAITDTFSAFAVESRNAGADGLFFATLQWASSDMITWDEYRIFGVPYDLEVMGAMDTEAINLLHVCAGSNYLEQLSRLDYSCLMYNWDSQDPTNLPIDRSDEILTGRTVVGGVDHNGWLLHSDAAEVAHRIAVLKDENDPSNFIIGPGCCVPPEVPIENYRAIRENL